MKNFYFFNIVGFVLFFDLRNFPLVYVFRVVPKKHGLTNFLVSENEKKTEIKKLVKPVLFGVKKLFFEIKKHAIVKNKVKSLKKTKKMSHFLDF